MSNEPLDPTAETAAGQRQRYVLEYSESNTVKI